MCRILVKRIIEVVLKGALTCSVIIFLEPHRGWLAYNIAQVKATAGKRKNKLVIITRVYMVTKIIREGMRIKVHFVRYSVRTINRITVESGTGNSM